MADDNQDMEQRIKLTYETNANKAAKDVDKLDESIEKTVESQKKAKKSSNDMTKGLDDLGGGIGSTITQTKGLIKQMWLLVANPIGLVIAAIALALTGLFKAFTSTNDGADKMEQIMAGLGAVMDILRDRFLKVVDVLKKLFTGDIIGAAKDYVNIFKGVGDEIAAEFKKAAEATRWLQEVDDAMRDLGVTRAKLNRDLVEAKELIDDENSSYAEKTEAIKKVQKAEEEQTAKELANAKKKLEAIKQLNALSDTSDEDLQKQADAEAALYQIEEQSARDKIKNQKLLRKADREEEARLKEIATARREAAKERAKLNEEERKEVEALANLKISEEEKALRALQDLNDKTEEEKLARKKERDLEEIEALRQKGIDVRNLLIYNDELYNTLEDELREKRVEEKRAKDEKERAEFLEAEKQYDAEKAAIRKAELEQQIAIENAKKGLLNGAVNLAKDIFGKNKKLQKGILIAENAAALAKVTMNTVEAVAKDNAASPLTLGQPWAGIHIGQGALGAASIIASTAAGLKALGGGSAGSAPSMGGRGGGGGGASAAPQVGFQASSENQIATNISNNNRDMPPVKAYVVTSDVTTGQALDRNKIDENSFG